MSKKKKHPEHVNNERWLVSYADFITLLFAFFVVMFATTYTPNNEMGKSLIQASQAAFIAPIFDTGGSDMVGNKMHAVKSGVDLGNSRSALSTTSDKNGTIDRPQNLNPDLDEAFSEGSGVRDQVTREYYDKIAATQSLDVSLESRGLVISFKGVALFDQGSDQLSAQAQDALDRVVKMISGRKNSIQVEGYSDGTTLDKGKFASNMEVSSKRAEQVATVLSKKYKVPAEYISTAGYGGLRPIGDTKTTDGRAKNRRVDIVLLNTAPDENHLALPKENLGPRQKAVLAGQEN